MKEKGACGEKELEQKEDEGDPLFKGDTAESVFHRGGVEPANPAISDDKKGAAAWEYPEDRKQEEEERLSIEGHSGFAAGVFNFRDHAACCLLITNPGGPQLLETFVKGLAGGGARCETELGRKTGA
jgi:hypothetical protein